MTGEAGAPPFSRGVAGHGAGGSLEEGDRSSWARAPASQRPKFIYFGNQLLALTWPTDLIPSAQQFSPKVQRGTTLESQR